MSMSFRKAPSRTTTCSAVERGRLGRGATASRPTVAGVRIALDRQSGGLRTGGPLPRGRARPVVARGAVPTCVLTPVCGGRCRLPRAGLPVSLSGLASASLPQRNLETRRRSARDCVCSCIRKQLKIVLEKRLKALSCLRHHQGPAARNVLPPHQHQPEVSLVLRLEGSSVSR